MFISALVEIQEQVTLLPTLSGAKFKMDIPAAENPGTEQTQLFAGNHKA